MILSLIIYPISFSMILWLTLHFLLILPRIISQIKLLTLKSFSSLLLRMHLSRDWSCSHHLILIWGPPAGVETRAFKRSGTQTTNSLTSQQFGRLVPGLPIQLKQTGWRQPETRPAVTRTPPRTHLPRSDQCGAPNPTRNLKTLASHGPSRTC